MNWSEHNRIAFGIAVRNARERMHMTQEQLAKKVLAQISGSCNQKKYARLN